MIGGEGIVASRVDRQGALILSPLPGLRELTVAYTVNPFNPGKYRGRLFEALEAPMKTVHPDGKHARRVQEHNIYYWATQYLRACCICPRGIKAAFRY